MGKIKDITGQRFGKLTVQYIRAGEPMENDTLIAEKKQMYKAVVCVVVIQNPVVVAIMIQRMLKI